MHTLCRCFRACIYPVKMMTALYAIDVRMIKSSLGIVISVKINININTELSTSVPVRNRSRESSTIRKLRSLDEMPKPDATPQRCTHRCRIHSRRRPAGPMGSDNGAHSPPNAGCSP